MKKGQDVFCIINTRATDYLTIGKRYTLVENESYSSFCIIADDGYENDFSNSRFMSAAEYRTIAINEILK